MIAMLRRLAISPKSNLDLLAAWVVTVAVHTVVPDEVILARLDLVPWFTLCMTLVAVLRAQPLGDPHHPSLSVRRASWSGLFGRVGYALAPIATLLVYDAAAGRADPWGTDLLTPIAAAACLVVAVLLTIGNAQGLTSWNPPGPNTFVVWTLRGLLFLGVVVVLGHYNTAPVTRGPGATAAALLGAQFLALGLLPDRIQSYRQRRAAGRRDGKMHNPPAFRFLLAAFGPSLGLGLLIVVHDALGMTISFTQSTVVSLHVFAWAAVIWPPRVPVAVSCILHEVVPSGGGDPAVSGTKASFDLPAKGALRLDPLAIKRVSILHHWVVPVQDPRIEDFDDPVRLLWSRPSLPLPYHVLGEATFEPDDATQLPQWDTITIRLDEQRDVGRLSDGNVQTRRLAVLRPFPTRGRGGARTVRTYRWDKRVAPGALQVVDATTQSIELRNGDLLVLSTEGVARAYELEIAAPIFASDELAHRRGPHLEDYVGVS